MTLGRTLSTTLGASLRSTCRGSSLPWAQEQQPIILASAPPAGSTLWLKETGISGSPIDSIANAGSAAGSISAATTARASVGTVASKSAAVYNGTANVEGSGPVLSSLISAAAYTVGSVVKLGALGSGVNGFDMPAVLTDGTGVAGGNWYPIVVNGTGFVAGHFDAADKKTAAIAVSTGVVYYVEVFYNGTTISLTVNGSTQTVAAGNVGAVTQVTRQGANYASAAWLNGTICETIVYNTALSAGDRATLATYMRARWGAT